MKTLDRTRDFGTISGMMDNGARYEQDGLHFDGQGNCVSDKAYVKPDAPPARDTRTTTSADPAILEQIQKQAEGGAAGSTEIVVGAQTETLTELDTLGLAKKFESALRGAEIDSVEALCRCTEEQLVALPNIGDAAVKAIKKALKAAQKKLAG